MHCCIEFRVAQFLRGGAPREFVPRSSHSFGRNSCRVSATVVYENVLTFSPTSKRSNTVIRFKRFLSPIVFDRCTVDYQDNSVILATPATRRERRADRRGHRSLISAARQVSKQSRARRRLRRVPIECSITQETLVLGIVRCRVRQVTVTPLVPVTLTRNRL